MSRVVNTPADLTGLERAGLAYMLRNQFLTQQQYDFSERLYAFIEAEAQTAGLSQEHVNVILRSARDVGNVFGGAVDDVAGKDGLARDAYLDQARVAVEDGKIGARLLDTALSLEGLQ